MSTQCVSEQILTSMLAGELPQQEEDRIAAHLQTCARCELLADQVADDGQIRELQVMHRRRSADSDNDAAQLAALRERLRTPPERPERSPNRSEFLAQSPEGDDSHPRGGSSTLGGLVGPPPLEPEDERPDALGPFRIVRLLGAGSFGFVYEALDQRLGRRVALKLPRSNVLADPDLKRRFLREAEALARLDHPNIVPVFEVGEHREESERGSTCYLAIALCDGPTLADWMQDRATPADPRLAAQVALPLAEAVAHAHSRQILHRDIKPANILLDRAPEGGELPFTPRLTDFGLAKIAESPSQATLGGLVLGTPQYMAPEQAAGHLERIGPATDVYSLGAVLYELLTGQPPIAGNSPVDTLRRVLIDEPPPVRRLQPRTPEDLEAIVMKCLDKSSGRRYAGAAQLAADLRRFLAGRPTQARPLGVVERAGRWMQRNRASCTALALVAIVFALSAGILFYDQRLKDIRIAAAAATQKSSQLERQIESSGRVVEDLAYVNAIRTASRAVEDNDLAQAAAVLSTYIPTDGETDRRCLAWHFLWSRTAHDAHAEINVGTNVYQLRFSDDGSQLAAACADGSVRLYDAQSAKLRQKIITGQGEINGAAFDSDGNRLASAGDDGTVKVWRISDRQPLHTFQAAASHAYGALFFGADRLLTIGRDPAVGLWPLQMDAMTQRLEGHAEAIEAMSLSPDGRLLATASSDRTATIWDTKTWQPIRRFDQHQGRLSSVAFSPDSALLATGALDQRVLVFDVKSGDCVALGVHFDAIQSLAFIADGGRLVSGDRAGTIHKWRIDPNRTPGNPVNLNLDALEDSWHAHEGRVWSLTSIAGSGDFVSSGEDGRIRFWKRGKRLVKTISPAEGDHYTAIRCSSDGQLLYAASADKGVIAFDPDTGNELLSLPVLLDQFTAMELLPRHGLLAAGTENGQLVLWDLATREPVGWHDVGQGRSIDDLVYSHQADRLAVSCDTDEIWLFEPTAREVIGRLPAEAHNAMSFSPDGRQIAVDTLNQIVIFDVQSCRELRRIRAHKSTVKSLAWSPNGQWIASASADRTVRLWTPAGELAGTLTGHRHTASAVAFSPDSSVLISGDQVGSVRFTHVATRRELFTLPTQSTYIRQLISLPDNRRIAIRGMHYDIAIIGWPTREKATEPRAAE